MSIQTFILNLFPKHYELQQELEYAKAEMLRARESERRLRLELTQAHGNAAESRREIFQLRRELQAEKLRNELPRVFLTKNQILKLMATSNLDPEIHRELEQTYEKLVQLQVRKERQSDSL